MLKEADIDVWVDHEEVRGGDSIPKRINEALDRCDIVLLVWSARASDSIWVEREWSAAMHLNKVIIPCLLDDTDVPHLLTSYASIDFQDIESGWTELIRIFQPNSTLALESNSPDHSAPSGLYKKRFRWLVVFLGAFSLLVSTYLMFSGMKKKAHNYY